MSKSLALKEKMYCWHKKSPWSRKKKGGGGYLCPLSVFSVNLQV